MNTEIPTNPPVFILAHMFTNFGASLHKATAWLAFVIVVFAAQHAIAESNPTAAPSTNPLVGRWLPDVMKNLESSPEYQAATDEVKKAMKIVEENRSENKVPVYEFTSSSMLIFNEKGEKETEELYSVKETTKSAVMVELTDEDGQKHVETFNVSGDQLSENVENIEFFYVRQKEATKTAAK